MKHSYLFKSFFILCLLGLLSSTANSQKTAFNFNAYSGLFSYLGNGTMVEPVFVQLDFITPVQHYQYKDLVNYYGRNSGFSWSVEFQVERVTHSNYLYGIGLSYEALSSTSKLNNAVIYNETGDAQNMLLTGDVTNFASNGIASLKNNLITLNPFLGKRLKIRKMNFDFTTGVDLALCLKSNVLGKGNYLNNNVNNSISYSNSIARPNVDIRPRIQLKTNFRDLNFLAGYSLGLRNFLPAGYPKVYSSFFRLGLGYQLK